MCGQNGGSLHIQRTLGSGMGNGDIFGANSLSPRRRRILPKVVATLPAGKL